MPDIHETVLAFLAAETWNKSKKIVLAHPELLAPAGEVDAAFQQLAEAHLDSPEGIRDLVEHQELLANCRRVGVEAAFAAHAGIRTLTVRSFLEWVRPALFTGLGLVIVIGLMGWLVRAYGLLAIVQAIVVVLLVSGLVSLGWWQRAWRRGLGGAVPFDVQVLILRAMFLEVAGDWGWFRITRNDQRRVELLARALQRAQRTRSPLLVASIRFELANTLSTSQAADRANNLEQAMAYYQQALEAFQEGPDPRDWAITHLSLANAYRVRSTLGSREQYWDDLLRAIDHYEQGLTVLDDAHVRADLASLQLDLAGLLIDLNRQQGPKDPELAHYPERAAQTARDVLESWDWRRSRPQLWARAQETLGTAYLEQKGPVRPDELREAIACFQRAAGVYAHERESLAQARVAVLLGKAYRDWYQIQPALDHLTHAIHHLQRALDDYGQESQVRDALTTASSLASLYFDIAHWAAAEQVYQIAIRYAEDVFGAAYTETGRRIEVTEINRLYTQAAYCLLRLERPAEALIKLEQGKTRILNEVLALAGVDVARLSAEQGQALDRARQAIRGLEAELRLPHNSPEYHTGRNLPERLRVARADLSHLISAIRVDHPDFMPTGLTLAEILALIPAGGALVVPIVTSQGSAAFVVPHGTDSVTLADVVSLAGLTYERLSALLTGGEAAYPGWLAAYVRRGEGEATWKAAIEQITKELWELFLAPIDARLRELQVTRVVLLLSGGLQLLPLHAAWHDVDDGRRHLIDHYEVTYAPSSYALSVSKRRADQAPGRTALIAGVSDYQGLPSLDFARLEAEEVSRLFQTSPALDEAVTPQLVQQALGHVAYLHLACHGSFAWGQDPLASELSLAAGAQLSLADILSNTIITASRLVTLSACETGLVEVRHSPDEYVGLPAGFLQAGAAGVVSSLWAVNDISTALLMIKFYEFHLRYDKMPLAAALRQAQLWLRGVTNSELSEWFDRYRHKVLTQQGYLAYPAAQDVFRKFTLGDPDACPFSHPYYWAAFTFCGA